MYPAAALVAILLSGDPPDQIASGEGAEWSTAAPLRAAWIADSIALAPPDGPPAAEAAPPAPQSRSPPPAPVEESAPAPAFQLALEGARGSRGETTLQAVAQWRGDGVSIGLGAEGAAGPRVATRQGLVAQAEVALASIAFHGQLWLRPAQGGAARSRAELGARLEGDSGSLDLTAHGVSALATFDARGPSAVPEGEVSFLAVGAATEAELVVSRAVAVGVRIAAAANQLRWSGRAPDQPWDALGSCLQEWPDRWEAMASLRATAGPAALTVSGGAGAPAAPGTLSARGTTRLDLELGASTVSAAASVAHQWPAGLWFAELTLGATFRFGRR